MPVGRSVLGGAAIALGTLATPAECFAPSQSCLLRSSPTLRMASTAVSAPPAPTAVAETTMKELKQPPKTSAVQETFGLVGDMFSAHFRPFSNIKVPDQPVQRIIGGKGDNDRAPAPPSYRSPGNPNERVAAHAWETQEDLRSGLERKEDGVLTTVSRSLVGKASSVVARSVTATAALVWTILTAHLSSVIGALAAVVKPFEGKARSSPAPPSSLSDSATLARDRTAAVVADAKTFTQPAPVSLEVMDILARVKAMEEGKAPSAVASAPSVEAPPSFAAPSATVSVPAPAPPSGNSVDDVLARVQMMEQTKTQGSASAQALPPPAAPAFASPPPSPSSPAAASASPSLPTGNDVDSVMARLRAMEEQAQQRK